MRRDHVSRRNFWPKRRIAQPKHTYCQELRNESRSRPGRQRIALAAPQARGDADRVGGIADRVRREAFSASSQYPSSISFSATTAPVETSGGSIRRTRRRRRGCPPRRVEAPAPQPPPLRPSCAASPASCRRAAVRLTPFSGTDMFQPWHGVDRRVSADEG